MDNFAKQAFEDALEKQADDEFQAWMKFSDKEFMVAHMAVVTLIGFDKIDSLCGAAIKAGQANTLTEYAYKLMMMAFHIGYKARREEEG